MYIHGTIIETNSQIPFSGAVELSEAQFAEIMTEVNENGHVNIRKLSFSLYGLNWSPNVYQLRNQLVDEIIFLDLDFSS